MYVAQETLDRAVPGFPDRGEPGRRAPALRLVAGGHEPSAPDLRRQVDAARDGDQEAFRQLFERYAPPLSRYARARLGDEGLAEDALQGVFLVVWRKIGDFRYLHEHEGSFVGWLFAIARRVVAEQARARTSIPVPVEERSEPSTTFEDGVLDRDELVRRLRTLPEGQREVLVLRFIVGLGATEVAESTGKSEARVKELQHRGLSRLRANGSGDRDGT
jgi:RNA polymerase sigma-70 factor (ECF subfamily)